MKKRLISMLMAVLMIASLLPASAVLAEETTACMHRGDVTEVSVKEDRAKKVAGVKAVICNDCGAILKSKDDRTVSADGVTITPFANKLLHKCKTSKIVVVQKAGCEQPGLTVSYCADCGKKFPVKDFKDKDGKDTYFEGEKALVHNYSDFHVEVAPTCLYDGWGYVLCKLCGAGKFVANTDAALNIVKDNKALSLAERNTLSTTVTKMFSATNPGHEDDSGFKLVTEETYAKDYNGDYKYENGQMIKLMPKTDTVHVKTIGGDVYKFNNKTGIYDKVADADKVELGYSGDKICPVCGEGFKVGEPDKATHKIDFDKTGTKTGTEPKVDAAGAYDRVYCEDCGWIGGDKIDKLSNTWTVPAKAATCTEDGTYKAVYTKDKDGNVTEKWYDGYKEVESTNGVIKAKDHTPGAVYIVNATCTEDGCIYAEKKICSVCGKVVGDVSVNDKVITHPGHKYEETELVAATCNHPGVMVKQCSECDKYELINDDLPFSDTNGVKNYTTAQKTKHTASDKLANVKEATCTEEGYTGDVVCKFCGEVMKPGEKTEMVDHTPVDVEAKAPTCTEPGVTKGTVCSVCKKVLSAQETVPALGHDPKLVNAKDATCTEAGYTGDKVCTRCNVTLEKGKDIKALDHNFVKGVCSRCDAKQPGYMPFKDVTKGDYYDAIMWAYTNDITKGTSTTTFGVNDGCTRAQIVTFLYRAAGEPEIKTTKCPFTDVRANSDYYKAILWAVENGITTGTSTTTFDPNAACTRAQIVTFLWRYAKSPVVSTLYSFNDVAKTDYYYNAVMWAVQNGVTKGTGNDAFSPDATCTRAQAVTFIYRDLVK